MKSVLLLLGLLHGTLAQGSSTTPAPTSTTPAPTTTPQPECSQGWLDFYRVGLGCLYFDTTQTLTWNDAQEFCHSQEESYLLEVLDEDQNHDIVMMCFQIAQVTQETRNWWMGLTDISFEDRWFWPHSLQPVDYSNWHGNEPNNGETYNYAYMDHTYDYEWIDTNEGDKKYTICQKL